METFLANPVFAGSLTLVVSALLTLAVRQFARKFGFVAKPKSDRWHKRPTAMLGGTAIFLATVLVYFIFVPITSASLTIIGASTFLFFVGLLDDLLNIKPYQKLIGQLIGAVIVVGLGLAVPLTGNELVDTFITGV